MSPASFRAASRASSAGLNGKAADTARITSYSAGATAPEGTSARNASGRQSMNASRDAARTSRVSAPIARPSAANASAPTASAANQSGKRPQSSSTNSPSPAIIKRQTATEQAAARPAFSASRPVF